jgi:hypothetical protein
MSLLELPLGQPQLILQHASPTIPADRVASVAWGIVCYSSGQYRTGQNGVAVWACLQ